MSFGQRRHENRFYCKLVMVISSSTYIRLLQEQFERMKTTLLLLIIITSIISRGGRAFRKLQHQITCDK